MERAFAVAGEVTRVATVVYDLAVALSIAFDEDVAVDVGVAIGWIVELFGMVTVYEVELAVAVFDPVVANDSSGRAVFEVVSPAAFAQGAKVVVLEGDVRGFGVVVVFVNAVFNAVVVDVTSFDEDIAGLAGAEEAVAAVAKDAVANGDVVAFFEEDGGAVVGIVFNAVASGKCVGGAA